MSWDRLEWLRPASLHRVGGRVPMKALLRQQYQTVLFLPWGLEVTLLVAKQRDSRVPKTKAESGPAVKGAMD